MWDAAYATLGYFFGSKDKRSRIGCGVCTETEMDGGIIQLHPCEHHFCGTCVGSYIRSKLSERRFLILCPTCMVGESTEEPSSSLPSPIQTWTLYTYSIVSYWPSRCSAGWHHSGRNGGLGCTRDGSGLHHPPLWTVSGPESTHESMPMMTYFPCVGVSVRSSWTVKITRKWTSLYVRSPAAITAGAGLAR